MYSKKDFGFSADFLKTVASVMSKNRNMTVSEIREKLDSGVWSADTPILEGKEALIYDRQLNRRISVNVISEAMDPVNKKALKKDFDDRKDKDIDNDGDTDDSDEYLHKRRKAISKAMKDEASCGTKRMKEDDDTRMGSITVKTDAERKRRAQAYRDKNGTKRMKEELDLEEVSREDALKHHVKVGELVNLTNPKATPRHKVVKIQGDKIHIQKNGNGEIQVFPLERVKRVKAATYKHQQSKLATEEMEVDIFEEAKKVTKKQLRDLEDRNEHGLVALKLAQSFGTPAEVKKIQDINKRHDMKGDIEYKDQKERDAIASKYWKMAEEVDLEEAKGDYVITLKGKEMFRGKSEADARSAFHKLRMKHGNDVKVIKEEVVFTEEDKKGYKKESDDSSNDDTMTDAQKNDMDGDGDKDKKGKKKNGKEKVDSIDTDPEMSDTMVQEGMSFKTPYGTVKVTKKDVKGKSQDAYKMTLHSKDGKTKDLGSHPNPTEKAVNSIVKRIMSEESESINEVSKEKLKKYIEKSKKDMRDRYYNDEDESNKKFNNRSKGLELALNKRDKNSKSKVPASEEFDDKKLASYEREKLDDLKKKHEGGKMHRALRRQYGDRGDEIFYGKLTKMAKGEYDGSQSKSEEFQLTAEDLNTLDELQRLGQQFDEARGRPPKGDDADDAGSKNFVMQMRKSVSLRGQNTVTFDDGSKMKVDQRKAQTFLNRFMDLKKPAEKEMLMKSASKSPKHFDMALQGKVAKDSKPSMLPPLKSEK